MASDNRQRDESIDVLRGAVMVLMALDHARDFFGDGARDPTDMAHTDAFLFFTRWVTHFCAPVFVLLAGVSGWMASQRRTANEASRLLATRGLWLVLLEVTVVRFGWLFDLQYRFTFLQVIWAIGWSMVTLALIARAGTRFSLAFGALMIALHNLFDGIHAVRFGSLGWLWKVLHDHGRLEPVSGHIVYVAYPLIPWIGVMAVGYGMGPHVAATDNESAPRRRKLLLTLGAVMTLAFGGLRWWGFYGDASPRQNEPTPVLTVLSFLNCTKYPPSLDYLLMTLGPAFFIWGLMTGRPLQLAAPLKTFGRVPLFYYVLHLMLLHAMAKLWVVAHGGSAALAIAAQSPHGTGGSLAVVYSGWALGILILWPLCRLFDRFKAHHRGAFWVPYV